MTFAHISDTHLGFRAYNRTNEHGINMREVDVLRSFRAALDALRRIADEERRESLGRLVEHDEGRMAGERAGDPAIVILGDQATPSSIAAVHVTCAGSACATRGSRPCTMRPRAVCSAASRRS